jgi:hypothetical protein
MAFSYVKYTGDGANRTFVVPFKYLDRRHVSVKVDGVNVAFSWLSSNSVQLNSTPTQGAVVEVRRKTPNVTPLVDFVDGATITERDLDLLAYQNLYLNQETADFGEELTEEVGGAAANIMVKVDQALASAASTENLADQAYTRAFNAEQFVVSVNGDVQTAKTEAIAAAADATTKAAQATASQTAAAASATTATTKATEASTSAAAAALSASQAAAAANFNPNDFYLRTELDPMLAAKANASHNHSISDVTGLQTALDAKAATSHTHAISGVTGLQAALDGKLATTGTASASARWATPRTITVSGNVTGSVTIDGTADVGMSLTVADNSHAHTIGNVTGLQTALDDKAALSHTHSVSQVTGAVATADKATNAEATAGTNDSKWMTPARTKDAIDALVQASGYKSFTRFAASTTWTVPAGVTEALFIVIGGGGGGGSYQSVGGYTGGNGGKGGLSIGRSTTLTPGASLTVTVGAGGGISGNGGSSSFSGISATGGGGGQGGTSSANGTSGSAGAGSGGFLNGSLDTYLSVEAIFHFLANQLAFGTFTSARVGFHNYVGRSEFRSGGSGTGGIAYDTSNTNTFHPGARGTGGTSSNASSGGVGGSVWILW